MKTHQEAAMKGLRIVTALALLTGLVFAQDISRAPATGRDLLTVAHSDRSLAMFVGGLTSCGMARMLKEEGPFTLFAVSNQAFVNLPKEDLQTLMTNPAAMHFLLSHYVVRGNLDASSTADLQSARTLSGLKLRTDVRSEGVYVNSATLSQQELHAVNGTIRVLDHFDPGFVHDAIALIAARK